MNIESITINAFLFTIDSDPFSDLCLDYELLGWAGGGGGNLRVDLKYSPEEISKEIRKDLIHINQTLPKPAAEITFHNGSKNGVEEDYDGQNDNILRNKLIVYDYLEIISLLQSQPLNGTYQPKIIDMS